MIRKQVYLAPEQDRKLKRLAACRSIPEAEVVREAIDRLPENEDPLIADLRAAGLLAPKRPLPPELQGKDLDALRKELEAELNGLPGVTLSDAILEERERERGG